VESICDQDKSLKGWRKIKLLRRQVKSQFRSTSQQVFRGKKENLKIAAVKKYLDLARQLYQRFSEVVSSAASPYSMVALYHFNNCVKKFIDQIQRRLLKGEVIPSEEKIYSIFEPHTEWLNKGKINPNVELGLNILITTDQNHLIIDYKVMEDEKDPSQVESLCERIAKLYPITKIKSHSFDKGFYSKENRAFLEAKEIENVIMPKRGKLNMAEKRIERTKTFKELRNDHSAIESNINMLEHHGLDRCPDKGLKNFKRYVGLSVFAYNLHIIGNHLMAKEKEKIKKESPPNLQYLKRVA